MKYRNAVVEVGAWVLGRRRRFRVTGDSMLPTLSPGSFVLVDNKRSPDVDDLVVAVHPTKGIEICKRITLVLPDGSLELASDNKDAGQDSRHFGAISPQSVRGVITLILSTP